VTKTERNEEKKMICHLDGDLVNFVQGVDAGNVDPVALNNINEVVGRGIAEHEVSVVNLVFSTNGLDLVCLYVGHCNLKRNEQKDNKKKGRGKLNIFSVNSVKDVPTVVLILSPPLSFLRKVILGGFLLRRIP